MEALSGTGWGCIVDCPPLAVSDIALHLASRAGKVVFVVGLGVSTEQSVADSLRTLRLSGVTVDGVVVNRPLPFS
jgi:Mrp family chromosome partitioning ATPase